MDKVLQIDKNVEKYIKLADERVAKDDLMGALFALKSARSFSKDVNILMRIADLYAEMGLVEISNRYWFKYMHVAPKDKMGVAFEELGINCFYMDNLWATGYYFHKKIELDGVISKERIDKEIIDFLSGDEFKNHAYRVVYPPERADFSLEAKNAKRAIGIGAFNEAVAMLERIPERSRTQENCDDLTVAYFMSDKLDEAEKESRRAIETYGESVWAYCNLSTVYELKKNPEKSEYYYQKALSLCTGERMESYKIITCAVERKDHQAVKKHIKAVIGERPYEIAMLFFEGVALINLGEYDQAVNVFKKAYALDSDDVISEYYYELAQKLASGEGEEKLIPLTYERRLPKKVESRWNARIRYLMDKPEKFVASVKNAENIKLFRWCLQHGSLSLTRSLAYNLATLTERTFYKLANQILMIPEVGETQKRLMIYLLCLCGYKGKVGVAFGVLYQPYQAKKLACEKDLDNPRFLTAYALGMSKYVFSDIEEIERIAKATDKVYFALKDQISETVTVEEIACLIISECAFKNYDDLHKICSRFNVQAKKVEQLKEKMKKVQND